MNFPEIFVWWQQRIVKLMNEVINVYISGPFLETFLRYYLLQLKQQYFFLYGYTFQKLYSGANKELQSSEILLDTTVANL